MKEQVLMYNTQVKGVVASAYSTRKTGQVVEEGKGAYMKDLAGLYSIDDQPYPVSVLGPTRSIVR
jgi:hypothetical protein